MRALTPEEQGWIVRERLKHGHDFEPPTFGLISKDDPNVTCRRCRGTFAVSYRLSVSLGSGPCVT